MQQQQSSFEQLDVESIGALQRALGSSRGSLAVDSASADIKLIKFAPLGSEPISSETTKGKLDLMSNKLWTIAKQSAAAAAAAATNQDDFQIVWTELSFKVDLSRYDKLINSLLEGVRTLCGLGSVSSQLVKGNRNDQSQLTANGRRKSINSVASSASSELNGPQKRIIFENLNGCARSGEITAILGPSGSGKTSLLNAICGKSENYTGRIQLVGGPESSRMRLSIIPQKDYLIENLTVRENLLYSSRILNTASEFDHESNIERVVKMLNLQACFHSIAANISGGEYKRVSIAQELLRQPDILVLDEPTSGLDSLNCKKLIQSLAQLIEASRVGQLKPIAIIMTIHQPDVDIFHMFDHVYCMARGGRVIFDGRPHEAMSTIREHSQLTGFTVTPPDNTHKQQPTQCFSKNPANLLIEIASEDLHGQLPIELLARHQRAQFAAIESPSQLQANLSLSVTTAAAAAAAAANQQQQLQKISQVTGQGESPAGSLARRKSAQQLARDKRLSASQDQNRGRFWYHTNVLARRAFVSTLRDPLMTMISLLFHLTLPFAMWIVYSNRIGRTHACPVIQRDLDIVSMASNRTVNKIQNLQEQLTTTFECSTMFFLTTYAFSMCSMTVASLAFPLSMHILLKEVRNGWYNLPAFVLAKTIATFPFEVLFPVLSLVVVYLMLGMPSSPWEWRLCLIALVMALVSMVSNTQGLIFGALCMDSVQTAIFLASASSLPQAMLSGFTARIRYMPWLLQKISWLSQYRYSSDLINMVRFGFGICPCDESTEDYLQTHQANFKDIPAHLKPIFIYYISQGSTSNETTDSDSNSTTITTTPATPIELPAQIPGVDYELMLNSSERAELISRMESSEVDLFNRMADMMGRSFTFGRKLTNCQSVRSEMLNTNDTPPDDQLPLMFASMIGLLLTLKLILYVIVRYKIGSRV